MSMVMLQEMLLKLLLLGSMSLTSGAAIMIVHGLLMWRRLRGSQSMGECVTKQAVFLASAAGLFTLLLLTQAETVPWDWLSTLVLMVATAPALLAWLGPPEEHVEASNLCQIGKGSAYGHFYGYLRLMNGTNSVRKRLEEFKRQDNPGLSAEEMNMFYSNAVIVLAPNNGEYPSDLSELGADRGIGKMRCDVPNFECNVGGNKRSYGKFNVHEVTRAGGDEKRFVALDKVSALNTLVKLQKHGPAGLSSSDCQKQRQEMMEELIKIIEKNSHLKGQLLVVQYDSVEHVGDAIIAAIDQASRSS